MLKSWLFIGLGMALLSIPSYAKTMTLTTNPYIDYNFTKNYVLSYSNGIFKIGKITITPSFNISNTIRNLNNTNNNIIMKDFKNRYEFGFNLSGISLSNINYIAFDMKGLKRLDDVSFTDGIIRIMFDDLIDKGSLAIVNDSRIILYNPTSLSIDPTIQLLSNTTNKAYYSGTLTSMNFDSATTEFSDANYNATNVSENIRFALLVTSTITQPRYKTSQYTFNLAPTGISYANINNITFCWEGFHNDNSGIGNTQLSWYNNTSASWSIWVASVDYGPLDTTYCLFFGTNNISNAYNSITGLFKFGGGTQANPLVTAKTSSINTDFLNLTIDYTAPVGTCTYSGSGNWFININDNCTLSTPNTVTGNIYLYGSNGYCDFNANQYAHQFYYNVSSLGSWFYDNYRWLY